MKIEQRILSPHSGWCVVDGTLFSSEVPQLALVIGARALLEEREVIDRVRATYPRTRIVFVSGAGAFSGAGTHDDQLVVTAVTFEKSRVDAVVRTVADRAQSLSTGRELAARLAAPDLVHVLVFSDGLRVNGSQLTEGMRQNLGANVAVTGGLAGDGTAFERTLVGLDGDLGPDRVVAVGLYGADLMVGHGCDSGWVPYGEELVVTRSEDNMLFELNGRPALECYRERLGDAAEGLPDSALRFPLHMTPADGGATVVRTSHSIDPETGIMEFAGDIPTQARVRFLRATAEQLMAGAERAARRALPVGPPELLLSVNCIARRLVLEEHAAEEMRRMHTVFGSQVPLAGFYSYGEIAPAVGAGGCDFHNQTMTVTALRER